MVSLGNISGGLDSFASAAGDIAGAAGDLLTAKGYDAEAAAYGTASTIAAENARIEKLSTGIQVAQTQRQIDLSIGGTKSDIAAAGLTEHGNAVDIIASSAQQGALQTQLQTIQGTLQQNAYLAQSSSYAGQEKSAEAAASAQRASAKGKSAGGVLKVVSGLFKIFCWVAREVYGIDNPKWLDFRWWMYTQAPDWFFDFYGKHGYAFAKYIHDKPLLKWIVRKAMDLTLFFGGVNAKYPRV